MREKEIIIIGIVAKHKQKNVGCEKVSITDATKKAIFDNGAIAIGILPTEYEVNFCGDKEFWPAAMLATSRCMPTVCAGAVCLSCGRWMSSTTRCWRNTRSY